MDEEKTYRQPWFKFYAQDWLTDLKVRRMSAADKACYLTILCLASSSGDRGTVKGVTEEDVLELANLSEAPELGNEYARGIGCIERFERNGCVTVARNADGTMDVTVVNFVRRQASSSTNAERQAKYRERQKTAQQGQKKDVTRRNERNSAVTTEVTYRGDKSREEKKGEGSAAAPTPRDTSSKFFSMTPEQADDFARDMAAKKGLDPEFCVREVRKFRSYWKELSRGGSRERWEMERTFEVQRRLEKWLENAASWSKGRREKPIDAIL